MWCQNGELQATQGAKTTWAGTLEDEQRREAGIWSVTRNRLAARGAKEQVLCEDSSLGHLHLIIGPVGAGKSTFALQLSHEHKATRLNLDDWMARLFRPDRPEVDVMTWYAERAERCIDQIWDLSQQQLSLSRNVILEIGLIERLQRERFYARVDAGAHELIVYALDAPREVRRERVERRNHEQGETFSMVVPPEVFEMASDMWQPPDGVECQERDIRFFIRHH